jgi:hypothetical protein
MEKNSLHWDYWEMMRNFIILTWVSLEFWDVFHEFSPIKSGIQKYQITKPI